MNIIRFVTTDFEKSEPMWQQHLEFFQALPRPDGSYLCAGLPLHSAVRSEIVNHHPEITILDHPMSHKPIGKHVKFFDHLKNPPTATSTAYEAWEAVYAETPIALFHPDA